MYSCFINYVCLFLRNFQFQKELEKEQSVKEGVERFLATVSKQSGQRSQNDVLVSSQDMLEASKAKIALLRMEIEKVVRSAEDDGNFRN